MTNPALLKYRLVVLLALLVALEVVQLFKLSESMSWSNIKPLNVVTSVCMGSFLVISIVARSFDLPASLRERLDQTVIGLFLLQTALVCIVSYLTAITFMPAPDIAQLFNTPVAATRRVVALGEGASLSLASLAMWSSAAQIWRTEIEARSASTARLVRLDEEDRRGRGAS